VLGRQEPGHRGPAICWRSALLPDGPGGRGGRFLYARRT
jgi:hypothetical protein